MRDGSERIVAQAAAKELRTYRKPTLTKGPVLSRITADSGGSIMRDALVG